MARLNRRTFLKAAGSGIGTVALAGEAALAGPDPQPARQRTVTGNSEIVVVGAGAFGGWTALYLREMGFTVSLVDQ